MADRTVRLRTLGHVYRAMLVFSAAQSSIVHADVGPDAGDQLDEVVVVAQKRQQNLQEVPISAEVVSNQVLTTQNLVSLTTLSQTLPSIQVSGAGRGDNLFIRGIGSNQGQAFDQAVGLFIDDIYHGRSRISDSTFLDLDHVEVLKGPQSIFFGNNAIAGAINIVTKKPTNALDASARMLYGMDGQYSAEGAIGGGITDTLAVRAAVTVDGMGGWLKNVNTGRSAPNENNGAARLSALFQPTADLDATLKVEGSKNRNQSGLYAQYQNCPPPAPFVAAGFCKTAVGLQSPIGLGRNEYDENAGQAIDLSTNEDVLTVNYHRWDHIFTSVTGFYSYHFNLDLDGDGLPLRLINVQAPEKYSQFSQELRAASPTDRRLEYLAGLYFQTDQLGARVDQSYFFLTPTIASRAPLAPLVPYLPLGQEINYAQHEQVYSAFGSAGWNLTQRLKLTAGIRASEVRKNYEWRLYYGTATSDYGGIAAVPTNLVPLAAALGLGTPGSLRGSRADHAFMPSANVQYKLSPDVMTYLSYSRGFLAGGFNSADNHDVAADLPFSSEYVNAYEAGIKSKWLNDRVLGNLVAFRSDYSDLQVVSQNVLSTAGTFVSLVTNAGSARSQGVEFEGQWLANRSLRLSTDLTYLDAHYVSFSNASPTALQAFQGRSTANLSGQATPYAPKWSGSASATYSTVLPGGYELINELSGHFSARYLQNSLDQWIGSYTRLDARLTLQSPDGRWALDAIGKNLTDRVIYTFYGVAPTSPGTTLVQTEQPRNVALQLRYHW